MTDIEFADHGSILLMNPRSDAGAYWLDAHIEITPEIQYWGTSIVVEARYAHDIIVGAQTAGLTVEVTQP